MVAPEGVRVRSGTRTESQTLRSRGSRRTDDKKERAEIMVYPGAIANPFSQLIRGTQALSTAGIHLVGTREGPQILQPAPVLLALGVQRRPARSKPRRVRGVDESPVCTIIANPAQRDWAGQPSPAQMSADNQIKICCSGDFRADQPMKTQAGSGGSWGRRDRRPSHVGRRMTSGVRRWPGQYSNTPLPTFRPSLPAFTY